VTERQWQACADPVLMLEWLRHAGKASDRKLLLFAVACCRTVWPIRPTRPAGQEAKRIVPIPPRMLEAFADREWRDRAAVEAAERFADGQLGVADFRAAVRNAAHNPAGLLARRGPFRMAAEVARSVADTVFIDAEGESPAAPEALCRLLRDVFGPLAFRSVSVAPSVLAWNDRTVRRLTQAIYDERAFDRLPVLADALEEAGLADAELLGHLRSAGPHVRGCWAIDAVLGLA